jgi:hypothetical protein
MAKDEAKEEEEFSCKKISVWLCMVEFWMGAYDCYRASPTAVKSVEAAREISHREIGVLKVVRTGTLKVSKSRHNRDHPFGRTCGSDWAPPGGARRQGLIGESRIRVSRVP